MHCANYKVKCSGCGRKILVEIFLIGVSHNASVSATCADCLNIHPDYKAKNPEEAKAIEEWQKNDI